jgi:polar amino acid transport system permease protein
VDGRRRGTRAPLSAAALPIDRRAAREAARRRRARRDTAIATVSTIVVIGALVAAIVTSQGWPTVKETFFSWESLKASFPDVLKGFWLDVRLFVIVELVVLVAGMAIALARTSRAPALAPLRLLGAVFVDVLRGVPTILVVYLIGFGVPALELSGVPSDPVLLGGAALALSYSAYVAEVYRAGIDSIHPSQRAAALALGLTGRQALRHVVLPQAVRRVVPPLLNDFISLQKDVALVSVLGVVEAFRQAQIDASRDFNYTPLLAAALLYIAVTVPLARILDRQQARARRRTGQTMTV